MSTNKNKHDLIEMIATQADITKTAAETALNALIAAVTSTLVQGGKVSIINFGSFESAKRAARTGRNPRTGGEMIIPAAVVPKFKAGKKLKDALNGAE